MIRKCTDEDISDEELEKIINPRIINLRRNLVDMQLKKKQKMLSLNSN